MAIVLVPHRTTGNVYVRELGRAYTAAGHSVIYGSENLLEGNVLPDLIHLQWPEELYRWRGEGAIDARIEKMLCCLNSVKERGCKIAWTVHNLTPHEHAEDAADAGAYRRVAWLADLLVHHCESSVKLLAKRYPGLEGKEHAVVPHGHYLSYPNDSSRAAARQALDISDDSFVYLYFGQIRGYKGLGGLFDAFGRVKNRRKYLLIAGEYIESSTSRFLGDRMRLLYAKRLQSNVGIWTREIPSESIQIYMNAADCVVLSHSSGLNSGVAVLGMTFGKLVVGPNIGCIGSVLDQGKNITYEAGAIDRMAEAMERASHAPAESWGRHNAAVAALWRWEDIVSVVASRLAM